MGFFSFGSSASAEQDDEILAAFGVDEQDIANQTEQGQIPWHCGWCEPYVNGATTGICASCEAEHFPKKR